MTQLENNEFRRILGISGALHTVVIAITLATTSNLVHKSYIQATANSGQVNYIWADAVQRPKKTAKDKLPAPIVKPQPLPSKPKPKVVAKVKENPKKVAKAKTKPKEKSKDTDLTDALNAAVASIEDQANAQPTPRPDNFPSQENTETTGVPAGPGGISTGMLGGNPEFAGYTSQIQSILVNNFIWLQDQKNLIATITFRIDAFGNVLEPKIANSSGNPAYDRAALRAVQKSSPLPTPPDKFATQVIQDTFSVNFKPKRK